MSDKLRERVLYLSVPESLRGQIEGISHNDEDAFSIDPEIPIPVEIPRDGKTLSMEELSWEMIISGMLLVIKSGEEKEEWVDYYRRFTLAVRPSILQEFTDAAIIKAKSHEFDLSLEILDTLQGLFPSSPAVMLNRALVLEQYASFIEAKDKPASDDLFRAAEKAYTDTMSLHPEFPGALFNAGFFYLGRNDFRNARECFSLFIDVTDDDDEKKEKANSIIKDIDNSGLEDESYSRACDLIRQGKEEAGMESIRGFIETYPSVWNGWFVLGWALRRIGRWEDGAAALSKAIELGGSGCDTRNELAICLMESGDLKGARNQLETALHDDPENVKIISNLGILAMKNGNCAEASGFFRTVLELDPEDIIAKNFFNTN